MAKRQKLSFVELDDLPDEIILKIFTFLDIKEILKCGQISQRIRAISNDESLWLQLNFFEGHVPYGLLEKDLEDICIGHIYPNPTKAIQKLFKRCVELVEINFSNSLDYESKLFTAMASNLTPKIKKVNLSRNENLKDRHVKILVQRCNQICELDFYLNHKKICG